MKYESSYRLLIVLLSSTAHSIMEASIPAIDIKKFVSVQNLMDTFEEEQQQLDYELEKVVYEKNKYPATAAIKAFMSQANISNKWQAAAVINQLSEGPLDWSTVYQVGAYSNTIAPGGIYTVVATDRSQDSAQMIMYDNCGVTQQKSYKKNTKDWWQFNWNLIDPSKKIVITNCNGTVINHADGCDLKNAKCVERIHRSTSYIYNSANPSKGVLKSEYLLHPNNYPDITKMLLKNTNSSAYTSEALRPANKFRKLVNSTPCTPVVNSNRPLNITIWQAKGILEELSQGSGVWATVYDVGAYSNALQAGGIYKPEVSGARMVALGSCGEKECKNYGGGWWPFDWEHTSAANCDGTIISTTRGCDLSRASCPYSSHNYTSYIYDPTFPARGVLIRDYLSNPTPYPGITAMLLIKTSVHASYLTKKIRGVNTNYRVGMNEVGDFAGGLGNMLCHKPSTFSFEVADIDPVADAITVAADHGDYSGAMKFNACDFSTVKGILSCKYADGVNNCAASSVGVSTWMNCPTNLDIIVNAQDGHGHFECNFNS
jgi:hypothetical protein